MENLAATGIRPPDRPARSQSLYRLSYPAHGVRVTAIIYISQQDVSKMDSFQRKSLQKNIQAYVGQGAVGNRHSDEIYNLYRDAAQSILIRLNLLAPEFYIQILAHPVCKM